MANHGDVRYFQSGMVRSVLHEGCTGTVFSRQSYHCANTWFVIHEIETSRKRETSLVLCEANESRCQQQIVLCLAAGDANRQAVVLPRGGPSNYISFSGLPYSYVRILGANNIHVIIIVMTI
jgi:hypothetical protein